MVSIGDVAVFVKDTASRKIQSSLSAMNGLGLDHVYSFV